MYKLVALLALGLALAPFWQDEDRPANTELQRQEIVNLENEYRHLFPPCVQ